MKKLVFFLLIIASAPVVKAQTYSNDIPNNRGALRVHLSDNSPISIEVDDRRFKRRGTSLTVGDLPKGRHYIKILENDDYDRRHPRVLYEGPVRIHKHKLTEAILDLNTGHLDESLQDLPAMNAQQPNNGQGNMQANGNNYNNNGDDNRNGYRGNQNDYNNGNPPPRRPNMPPPPPAKVYAPVPADYVAITDDGIAKTKVKVNEKITDTDKLKVLEAALKKKSFTTAQLGEMIGWLTFEESKLELAKWAYEHTMDKNNFPSLEQTRFSEDNNRNDLDSYINSQR